MRVSAPRADQTIVSRRCPQAVVGECSTRRGRYTSVQTHKPDWPRQKPGSAVERPACGRVIGIARRTAEGDCGYTEAYSPCSTWQRMMAPACADAHDFGILGRAIIGHRLRPRRLSCAMNVF